MISFYTYKKNIFFDDLNVQLKKNHHNIHKNHKNHQNINKGHSNIHVQYFLTNYMFTACFS